MEAHSRAGPEMSIAAHVCQPAIRSPSPVADYRINETSNANAVEKIANEASPSDHRAGSDGRACVRERELEDPDGEERDACAFISVRRVLQEEPVIADKPVAVREHESKTYGVKKNAAQARVHHTLDENVNRFARAAEAGLEHRKSDLHAEHEERRH